MTAFVRLSAAGLLVLGAAVPLVATAAAPEDAPAAARFYPLVGNWKGNGQTGDTGKAPEQLSLALSCKKAAAGWAVLCTLDGKGKDMTMAEADLFGVDPVTGQGHWYAVSNAGETHDHLVTWTDHKTFQAHYSWTQDGKKMDETIKLSLPTPKTMEFTGDVTADGQPASFFTGKLSR